MTKRCQFRRLNQRMVLRKVTYLSYFFKVLKTTFFPQCIKKEASIDAISNTNISIDLGSIYTFNMDSCNVFMYYAFKTSDTWMLVHSKVHAFKKISNCERNSVNLCLIKFCLKNPAAYFGKVLPHFFPWGRLTAL